jgi:diguanylate cyclase (GGDEF)-like protein
MRGHKKTRHIPIIFVTAGLPETSQVFRGYDSGAVDYLFKPLEPTIFKGKVGVFMELFQQREALEEKTRELDRRLLELEELQQQLEETNEQLRQLSVIDGLTGLLNRRRFDEILTEEWQRGAREQKSLALLLIDIDHFKLYNDTYGHLRGDAALKKVAQALSSSTQRQTDRIARYGGEEFVAILPDTDLNGAMLVAEKMRKAIANLALEQSTLATRRVLSVSIGIASTIPNTRQSRLALIQSADSALYQAKENGRNRCISRQDCVEGDIVEHQMASLLTNPI